MFFTIITDCIDSNAFGRQLTRAASLCHCPVIPVAIQPSLDAPSDLEAGGHLIDMLDASRGAPGIILVNKAPRSGKAKKRPNGTPFGYFWYKQTLVFSSIDGHALSLAKKLGLFDTIHVCDIPTVMDFAVKQDLISSQDAEYVIDTQFRSFEFLPRVAKRVFDGLAVPYTVLPQSDIADAPDAVFFADVFGNLKTTVLPEEIGFAENTSITLKHFGPLMCYKKLKDLPNGESGLIVGSSGLENNRFVEIMTQGKSAKNMFGVDVGMMVER